MHKSEEISDRVTFPCVQYGRNFCLFLGTCVSDIDVLDGRPPARSNIFTEIIALNVV